MRITAREIQTAKTAEAWRHGPEGHTNQLHKTSGLAPCDGCASYKTCAVEHMACKAYIIYAGNKNASVKTDLWVGAERNPSKEMYRSIYGED